MSIRRDWRIIDTGLRPAAQNLAINRAMLEARQADEIPNTLRFLRFEPSALVGFHQSVAQELREDYCRQHGIVIQRRITGGGAIYFDETQIGWELYLDRRLMGTSDMLDIARRVCEIAARGIRALGVNARFRPRNDIEVDGRKIAGTGGAFDGNAILYQGTLLVEFDVERMLRVLRVPAEKLSDKAIASARERVVSLKELMGHTPSLEQVKTCLAHAFAQDLEVNFAPTPDLTEIEQERYRAALAEIDSLEWVYEHNGPMGETTIVEGMHKSPGGLVRASVSVDAVRQRIKQVWITGDFFVNPKRMVLDLETALCDVPVGEFRRTMDAFFDSYSVEMLLLRREDFVEAIGMALNRLPRTKGSVPA